MLMELTLLVILADLEQFVDVILTKSFLDNECVALNDVRDYMLKSAKINKPLQRMGIQDRSELAWKQAWQECESFPSWGTRFSLWYLRCC